ncbi:MAG: hypothetical protein O9331_10475, partial [Acidovorax sp.]|nr:hypothetical protein [Acidovorax sp.]
TVHAELVEAPHSLCPGFDKLSPNGLFKFKEAGSIKPLLWWRHRRRSGLCAAKPVSDLKQQR